MNENQIVKGTVKSVHDKHFWVDLPNGYQGVVFISEVSDFFVSDISKIVNVGEQIKLKILSINHNNKKATLSYKAVHNYLQKNPYVYSMKPTKNGFTNLFIHAEEEIRKWKK